MNLPVAQGPAPVATRIGQGTAVEQSRAVAEVQAAIVVAQQVPRRIDVARTAMQESCAQLRLADRAFYSFQRGGQTVAGASVYLARELARCWGNVQHGLVELRRDDSLGQSEMQAWAWDVQTNTRTSHTFIVPHKRDKRGGPVDLVDLRDIYENNANQGARRLREAIFAILPPWFVEEATDLCRQTLNAGDGRPLEERVDGAVAAFDALGVTLAQLEQKLGRTRDKWTGPDLAQLRITHKSIQRAELAVDEAFPQVRVTVDEIVAAPPAAAPPAAPPADTRTEAEQKVGQLMANLEDSVDAAKAARDAARPEPDLQAAAEAGQAAATRVAQRNAAGQAPPPGLTARQLAQKSGLTFADHVEVGPRGGKSNRMIDRLRHALVYAQTGGTVTTSNACTPEQLLAVWQRLDDIAEGRMTYELEPDSGVTWVLGTGKRVTVMWTELEGEPEPAVGAS